MAEPCSDKHIKMGNPTTGGSPSRVRQARPFDAESDDWPQYEERMTCYF